MAKQTLINTADDMRWLRDVHLPRLSSKYKSAVIVGNEDYPDRIEVYARREPDMADVPVVYEADGEGIFREKGKTNHATKKARAQLDREIAEVLAKPALPSAGRGAHATKRPTKARVVNVEAKTPAGYRWLRLNARGATVTPEGFAVTDEHEWAQSLAAADAIEIPSSVGRRSHATMAPTTIVPTKWYFWTRKKGMYGQSWKKRPSWLYHSSFTDKAALDRAIREHKKDKWSVRVTLDREGKTAVKP